MVETLLTLIDILPDTEEKCQFFNNIIHLGPDTIIPAKTIKIHTQDAPRITGSLKSLIQNRQKALSQDCLTKFRFYRNRVNRERKRCKSVYYQTKVKYLNDTEPKKWWAECKKICGMNKPTKDIANLLLSNDSPSYEDKFNLANEINAAFLQPQQEYTPLSQTNKLDTTIISNCLQCPPIQYLSLATAFHVPQFSILAKATEPGLCIQGKRSR